MITRILVRFLIATTALIGWTSGLWAESGRGFGLSLGGSTMKPTIAGSGNEYLPFTPPEISGVVILAPVRFF
ncbi:MAG: hypothetical protein GY866_07940 [Proteobacteria bacterium]|nr:hypothetical protein [Pseudomonadota bacterium]